MKIMQNNNYIQKLYSRLDPQIILIKNKWRQLRPREKQLVSVMIVFLAVCILFSIGSWLITFNRSLSSEIRNLNKFSLYSKQSANVYKNLNKIEVNSFNNVNSEQIKGDLSQIFNVKNPDINFQDGQLTISLANVEFKQVMIMLEQFRRTYAIFPSQMNIIRQTKSGYVSFSVTFWIK
jgi:type II secretory pathway component PulM